jgi:hypothetical protein
MVQAEPEIKWPLNFWSSFQMAIQKPCCPVFKWLNTMEAKIGLALGWQVSAENNHFKCKLVWFSDVYCILHLSKRNKQRLLKCSMTVQCCHFQA